MQSRLKTIQLYKNDFKKTPEKQWWASASGESSHCPGDVCAPSHRHPLVHSPTHTWAGWCSSASWAGLPALKQVLSARVTPWYLRCDSGEPGPKRGPRAWTWNQWGATLWELIHLPAICSTQDSQQECYTSWQKHLPLTEWSTPACKLLMGEQTLAWQVCMRPAMTCSHPSFQGAAPTRGSSAPAEESPALCSSCSAQLDGKGFPAPNKPQADSQVSKPLAKGETVLLLFQVLCDLHLQSFWRLFPPTASSGGFFLPH